nr:hypothetical protein [Mycoplasmopsis bovis]
MIFIAPELKEDLFKKPGSEKFKSKLSDTYIPPVEFNNLLRNYLKGSGAFNARWTQKLFNKYDKFFRVWQTV